MPTLTVRPAAGDNSPIDGYVGRGSVSENFATIRSGSGNTSTSTSTSLGVLLQSTSGGSNLYFGLLRGILCFDTSSLPDGVTIVSATLRLRGVSKSNGFGGSPSLHVTSVSPASTAALANSDYGTFGSTSFGEISYAAFSASSYNEITLNSNGLAHINKTGVTAFGLRHSWDLTGTFDGSWGTDLMMSMGISSADETGTSQDPELVIEYGVTPTVALDTSDGYIFDTITPTVAFTGTDADGDDVTYEVQIDDTDNTFSSIVIDAVSDAHPGFANADNGGDTDPFTTGDRVNYTVEATYVYDDADTKYGDVTYASDAVIAPLGNGTYYWRVRSKDPLGNDEWGDWSETREFTIDTTPTAAANDAGLSLTVDATTISQNHTVASQDTSLALSLDNTTITQDHVIQPQDMGLSISADGTTVTNTDHFLAVDDALLSLTEDNTSIPDDDTVILGNDIALGLSTDNGTITQNHVIASGDIVLALSEDAATINQNHLLAVQDSGVGLLLDNATISQNHVIVIHDLLLETSTGNVLVSLPGGDPPASVTWIVGDAPDSGTHSVGDTVPLAMFAPAAIPSGTIGAGDTVGSAAWVAGDAETGTVLVGDDVGSGTWMPGGASNTTVVPGSGVSSASWVPGDDV